MIKHGHYRILILTRPRDTSSNDTNTTHPIHLSAYSFAHHCRSHHLLATPTSRCSSYPLNLTSSLQLAFTPTPTLTQERYTNSRYTSECSFPVKFNLSTQTFLPPCASPTYKALSCTDNLSYVGQVSNDPFSLGFDHPLYSMRPWCVAF